LDNLDNNNLIKNENKEIIQKDTKYFLKDKLKASDFIKNVIIYLI
jgi:hypothetical protein